MKNLRSANNTLETNTTQQISKYNNRLILAATGATKDYPDCFFTNPIFHSLQLAPKSLKQPNNNNKQALFPKLWSQLWPLVQIILSSTELIVVCPHIYSFLLFYFIKIYRLIRVDHMYSSLLFYPIQNHII